MITAESEKIQQPQFTVPKCAQQISKSGRIRVSKKAWMVRLLTVLGTSALVIYTVYLGMITYDPFIVAGVIIPTHSLAYMVIGWFLFKNPATGKLGNDLVSVIVPVYNQKGMIEIVIDAIHDPDGRRVGTGYLEMTGYR